ncbi:MAG: ATP-binding protein [Ignisphaera sp.]
MEFSLGKSRPSFSSILDVMDRWAEDRGEKLVFIIDEVQELVKMKGYSILPSIAYAYDNLRNISFVLAGSRIGLLYRFLKIYDVSSPLYGRYIERIELRPLSRELALEFLKKGFKYHGIEVDNKFIELAVEKLNGIIGWLSFLGLKALSKKSTDLSLIDEVVEEASKITVNEFCNFVEAMGSKRYIEIIKVLGDEGASWSQIKRYLELKLGTKIYDSELSRLLKNLIDSSFIEKKNSLYIISDPVLRRASKSIKC